MSDDTGTDAAQEQTVTAAELGIDTTAAEAEKVSVARHVPYVYSSKTDKSDSKHSSITGSIMEDESEDKKASAAGVETDPVEDSVDTQKADNTKTNDGEILEKKKNGNKTCIIFSVLLALAIAVGVAIYFIYVRMEAVRDQASRDQFDADAEEMNLYVQKNVDEAFASLNGLTNLTTSLVKRFSKDTEYPPGFINIPNVAQTLGEAKNASNALVIAYMPKVVNENFDLWESYSRTHSSWVAEEQPDGPKNVTPIIFDYVWEFTDYEWETKKGPRDRGLIDEIGDSAPQNGLRGNEPSRKLNKNRVIERPGDCSGNEERRRRDLATEDRRGLQMNGDDDALFPSSQIGVERSDDYFTPVWQLYPVPILDEMNPFVEIINYNLADRIVFKKATSYMEISKQPVFLDVCDQAGWFLIDEHRNILQTVISYPVFDDFSADKNIVGFYTAIIPWTELFKNSRSPTSKDMIIVMKNTCGEVFSVELEDNLVRILGEYDAHDPIFDDYVKIFSFAEKYNKALALASEKLFEEEVCLYDMYIYPKEK